MGPMEMGTGRLEEKTPVGSWWRHAGKVGKIGKKLIGINNMCCKMYILMDLEIIWISLESTLKNP